MRTILLALCAILLVACGPQVVDTTDGTTTGVTPTDSPSGARYSPGTCISSPTYEMYGGTVDADLHYKIISYDEANDQYVLESYISSTWAGDRTPAPAANFQNTDLWTPVDCP